MKCELGGHYATPFDTQICGILCRRPHGVSQLETCPLLNQLPIRSGNHLISKPEDRIHSVATAQHSVMTTGACFATRVARIQRRAVSRVSAGTMRYTEGEKEELAHRLLSICWFRMRVAGIQRRAVIRESSNERYGRRERGACIGCYLLQQYGMMKARLSRRF